LTNISSSGLAFSTFDPSIQVGFKAGKAKFDKYYEIISKTLIYFIAAVLDPCIKGAWIEKHYENGKTLLNDVRKYIHEIYPSRKLVGQSEEKDCKYQGL